MDVYTLGKKQGAGSLDLDLSRKEKGLDFGYNK
jgi:hypothetical protein